MFDVTLCPRCSGQNICAWLALGKGGKDGIADGGAEPTSALRCFFAV